MYTCLIILSSLLILSIFSIDFLIRKRNFNKVASLFRTYDLNADGFFIKNNKENILYFYNNFTSEEICKITKLSFSAVNLVLDKLTKSKIIQIIMIEVPATVYSLNKKPRNTTTFINVYVLTEKGKKNFVFK